MTVVIPWGPESWDEVGSTLVRLQIINPVLFIVTMNVAMMENGISAVGQPSANHNPFADWTMYEHKMVTMLSYVW